MPDDYFIYQWKPTNDLPKEHPTGAGKVYKNYNEFLEELKKIIKERSRKQIWMIDWFTTTLIFLLFPHK